MEAPTKRNQTADRPDPVPGRGAPATDAAHAVRKDLSARVYVKPAAAEPDEIKEEGYGHGV